MQIYALPSDANSFLDSSRQTPMCSESSIGRFIGYKRGAVGACGWAPHNKAIVTRPEAETIINESRRLVALLWGGACEVPRESMPLAPQRANSSASSARGNLGRSRQGGVR